VKCRKGEHNIAMFLARLIARYPRVSEFGLWLVEHNEDVRKLIKARNGFSCPFCGLKFKASFSLFYHLTEKHMSDLLNLVPSVARTWGMYGYMKRAEKFLE